MPKRPARPAATVPHFVDASVRPSTSSKPSTALPTRQEVPRIEGAALTAPLWWLIKDRITQPRTHLAAALLTAVFCGAIALLLAATSRPMWSAAPLALGGTIAVVYVAWVAILLTARLLQWLMRSVSRSWALYEGNDRQSVIAVRSDAKSRKWVLVDQISAGRGRGFGTAVRGSIVPNLIGRASARQVELVARVRVRKLRARLERQFPGTSFTGSEAVIHVGDRVPDTLGRSKAPERVADEVRRLIEDSQDTSTISALVGPWGSGKSWILERAGRLLEFTPARSVVRVIRFNPWAFSGEGALYAGFAQLLLRETRSKRMRRELARLLKTIGPSSKFGPIDLSGSLRVLSDSVDPTSSTGVIERAITSSLVRAGPVCVFIDDIDRLTSDELLTLFKLVRLLGNVPNLHYVLSFDEQTVLDLLSATSVANGNRFRARAYLEKVVEHRHTVPPLTLAQRHLQVATPILAFPSSRGFSVPTRNRERMESLVQSVLLPLIDTIRLGDRIVAEVTSMPAELGEEVDFGDWVLTCFLRVVAPPVWKLVVERRDDLIVVSADGAEIPDRRMDAERELTELGYAGPMLRGLVAVVDALFPAAPIGEQSRVEILGGQMVPEVVLRRGMGVATYFDRYTWADLPPGDRPEMELVRTLRALSSRERYGASRDLADLIKRREHDVLQQLPLAVSDGQVMVDAVLDALATILFGSSVFDWSSSQVSPLLVDAISEFASRVVMSADTTTRAVIFERALKSPVEWWQLTAVLRSEARGQELTSEIESLRDAAFLEASEKLQRRALTDESERSHIVRIFTIDRARAAEFVRARVSAGVWALDAVASVFVSITVRDHDRVYGTIPAAWIVDFFGKDLTAAVARAYPEGPFEQDFRKVEIITEDYVRYGSMVPEAVEHAIRAAIVQELDDRAIDR